MGSPEPRRCPLSEATTLSTRGDPSSATDRVSIRSPGAPRKPEHDERDTRCAKDAPLAESITRRLRLCPHTSGSATSAGGRARLKSRFPQRGDDHGGPAHTNHDRFRRPRCSAGAGPRCSTWGRPACPHRRPASPSEPAGLRRRLEGTAPAGLERDDLLRYMFRHERGAHSHHRRAG